MDTADWTSLCSSATEWGPKRAGLISELNKLFGDGFASVHGDLIRLTSKDGRTTGIRAVSPTEYRLGTHLDFGNDTGTPVAADKLIHHIGTFADGSVK